MNAFRFVRVSSALVAMGVLSSVGQAQVLTADTITGQPVDYALSLSNGRALTQTFTGAGQLDLVTFRFMTMSVLTPSVGATDVSFLLSEWSGADSTGTVVSAGVFSIASGASWTVTGGAADYFDSTFDFSGLSLNAGSTYGITLFGSSATDGLVGLGAIQAAGDTLYVSGTGFENPSAGAPNVASLTGGNSPLSHDFSFIASASSPVPEAGAAAVLFAGVFVGGLMTRRRRRQPVALDAARV